MTPLTNMLRHEIITAVMKEMRVCPVQYKVQEALYKQLPPDVVAAIKNNPEYYPEHEVVIGYIKDNRQLRAAIRVRGAIGPFLLGGSELLIKLGIYEELCEEVVTWISDEAHRGMLKVMLGNMLETYTDVGVLLRDFPEFEGILSKHLDLSEVVADPAHDLRRTLVPMLKANGWRGE